MRLLVIEDHAPLRETLARGLRDAGYAVDTTGSGVEGLWYAQNHPYDVVILDIMLPGIDGGWLTGMDEVAMKRVAVCHWRALRVAAAIDARTVSVGFSSCLHVPSETLPS